MDNTYKLEFKDFGKMPRLRDEEMWITEKIDGTNAQIAIEEVGDDYGHFYRRMYYGSRNRWLRDGESDNFGFRGWCLEHKEELLRLPLGRHYGEWWGSGIQRGYGQQFKRFSLFNQSLHEIVNIIPSISFVPVLYRGPLNLHKIDQVMEELKKNGSSAAPGFMDPEGVVVYLSKARLMFKKTFDDSHKGENEPRIVRSSEEPHSGLNQQRVG